MNSLFQLSTMFHNYQTVVGLLPKIQEAFKGGVSVAALAYAAQAVLTPETITMLETIAESFFPQVAPELKIAAVLMTNFDGDKVKWLQQAANALLGTNLAVDGLVGPQTHAAIQMLQQQLGLTPDGWLGATTAKAIEAALAEKPSAVAGAPAH